MIRALHCRLVRGLSGGMSSEVWTHLLHGVDKAKRASRCFDCRSEIPSGALRVYRYNLFKNTLQKQYACLPCELGMPRRAMEFLEGFDARSDAEKAEL